MKTTQDTDLSFIAPSRLAVCSTCLRSANEKLVNTIERTALSGMMAYVAHTQKVLPVIVRDALTSYYGIPEIKALPSRLYQNAVEFLVDLSMKQAVN